MADDADWEDSEAGMEVAGLEAMYSYDGLFLPSESGNSREFQILVKRPDAASNDGDGVDAADVAVILDFTLPQDYPESAQAQVSLDAPANSGLTPPQKTALTDGIKAASEGAEGGPAIFEIVNWVTEWVAEEFAEAAEKAADAKAAADEALEKEAEAALAAQKAAAGKAPEFGTRTKGGMTKRAKRRLMDVTGASGEKPRGHDWVDLIRHLSQTGRQ